MVTSISDISPSFGSIRDQGIRPTCLACAMSDAHAHLRGVPLDLLSAEYAFYFAAQRLPANSYLTGLTFEAAAKAIEVDGQPKEKAYPYLTAIGPAEPLPIPPSPMDRPIYQGSSTQFVGNSGSLNAILLQNIPAVLMLHVTVEMLRVSGPDYVVRHNVNSKRQGLHAVVAVGMGEDSTNEQCIKIRNSWGSAWGESGHAWIRSCYVDAHLDSYAIFQ